MRKLVVISIAVLSMFAGSQVFAGKAAVEKALKNMDPHTDIKSIKQSKVSGLYEVLIGTEVYYVSANGKYIISGDIYEASSRKNITALARGQVHLQMVNEAGEGGMIVYEPKKVKQTLTVFTDVDCPYCRKFHKDVPAHLASGIRIRYVMMPLQGLQASTYKKSVSVWCSKNRNKAMDTVKSGGSIKSKKCLNPIARNLALARKMGISSTPTLMTQEGVLLPGYVPPAQLLAKLGLAQNKQAAAK